MSRVKIGVVGCGAIAQIQHLPFLKELAEEYEVPIVCDISAKQADYVAKWFDVPRYVTDYRDLLSSNVDAVLLCQTDPKTEVAVAAFNAGKHVFIEKPMCFSLKEADSIVSAYKKSGKVGMVGYVKLYEPAFETAQKEVASINDVCFVQVNHLHPDNSHHIKQFRTRHFDDVPESVRKATQAARQAARRDAIGDVPLEAERAYFTLSGSMIHDLYGLRVLFGVPSRVVSTEVWSEGRAISTVLEYPNGTRCVATWVDLPQLWDFHETLEVYGGSKRVIVKYGTGFSRVVSTAKIWEIDSNGTAVEKQPAMAWESPFRREVRHFHECITKGRPCRSTVESAREDIALIIDITRAYIDKGPITRQVRVKKG